jgi:hypothetical protein
MGDLVSYKRGAEGLDPKLEARSDAERYGK